VVALTTNEKGDHDTLLRAKRNLRRQPNAHRTPENFIPFLRLHRDCSEEHVMIAREFTADDMESTPDPEIIEIRRMIYAVTTEIHRMKAFVRLNQLGDAVLYGTMRPEHRIGERVSAHFAFRFPRTIIVIGNRKESWVAFYNGGRVQHTRGGGLAETVEEIKGKLGEPSAGEDVSGLWDTFYHSQFTPRRRNMKRFNRMMPKKSLEAAGLVTEKRQDGVRTLDEYL